MWCHLWKRYWIGANYVRLPIFKNFAARFSFQIYFAARFSFQIYFAARFSFQIYFACYWSAKFILPVIGVQNLFCLLLECKIYFACYWSAKFILLLDFLDMSVLYSIGKRYNKVNHKITRNEKNRKMNLERKAGCKMNFALQVFL